MIYALITLYNPDKKVESNILQVSKQVDKVFLCDNSSNRYNLICMANNIEYIFNGNNLGIAAAYNKVLTNKGENELKDDDYIIFFDQDTHIADNHIKSLICEYEQLSLTYKIGCMGPAFINEHSGRKDIPRLKKSLSENSYQVKSVITSSMLTKYYVLEDVGYFNNNLFLDYVDFDLCWRMQQKGYICCWSNVCVMKHRVGISQLEFLGNKFNIGNPIRDYYQTRDSLFLLKKSYVPIKFRVRFIYRIISKPLMYRTKCKDYRIRKKYIMQGFKDARNKITGVINNENRDIYA